MLKRTLGDLGTQEETQEGMLQESWTLRGGLAVSWTLVGGTQVILWAVRGMPT